MPRLPRFERRIKVRGAKLAGQTSLSLPINDQPLELAGTEIWNTDGFFSSANKTRVTVPVGYRGIYSIHAVVHWGVGGWKTFFPDYRDGNFFVTQLRKTDSVSGDVREARAINEPTVPATITRQDVLWETSLSGNDTIEVLVSCEVCDQAIMDCYHELYGAGWTFQLEYWFTIRRLGKLP